MDWLLYRRTSTVEQGENNTSMSTQDEECRKKAVELGYPAEPKYVLTEMESGAFMDRPKLEEMLRIVMAVLGEPGYHPDPRPARPRPTALGNHHESICRIRCTPRVCQRVLRQLSRRATPCILHGMGSTKRADNDCRPLQVGQRGGGEVWAGTIGVRPGDLRIRLRPIDQVAENQRAGSAGGPADIPMGQ